MKRLKRIFNGMGEERDHIIYLGAGYWRARTHRDGTGRLLGVSLINSDRTPEEIEVVEKAFWLLP